MKRKSQKPRARRKARTPAPAPSKAPKQPTSYDSIGAAAAALGISRVLLRRAKLQGAPGFRGSRVYPAELLPWLRQREACGPGAGLPLDKEALECVRLRQRIEHEAYEFERDKGEWIRRAEVEAFFLEVGERIKTVLRTRLKNDLPPKLVGLQAPEIAARMDSVIAELIHLWRFGGAPAPIGATAQCSSERRSAVVSSEPPGPPALPAA